MKNLLTDIKRVNKTKQVLVCVITVLLVLGESSFLFFYLYRSTTAIQLMDFWIDAANRIQIWKDGSVTISDIFPFPHGLHMSYLGGIISGIVIRFFNCDNRIWVYGGLLIRVLTICFLVWYITRRRIIRKTSFFYSFAVAVITLPIINLNQWEILTLYCSLNFSIRILLFFLIFFLIDYIAVKKELEKHILIITIIFGSLSFFLVGTAYMYGAFGAISLALLIDLLCRKNLKKIMPYSIIVSAYAIVMVLYYITLLPSAVSSSSGSEKGLMDIVYHFGKGFLLMMGGIVVPLDTKPYMSTAIIVGVIILIVTIFSIVLFYKKKMWQITILPMLCILYSLFSMAVIIYGRAWSFGIESVSSSRYVVETTLLLVGVLIILIQSLEGFFNKKRYIIAIIPMTFLSVLVFGMIYADLSEWNRAPYVKGYFRTMIAYAYDLDYTTDEELKIFQSNPKKVREGLKTMKQYKIGIYSDKCLGEYADLKPQRHNDYETGQLISFGSDGKDAEFFYVKGLSVAEEGFSWTSDNYVYLTLCFSDESVPQSDTIYFRINYAAVYGEKQKVAIQINGVDVGSETLQGSGEVSIPIVNMFTSGRNEVCISLPDAVSPSETGGDDIRTLGIALKSISIENVEGRDR